MNMPADTNFCTYAWLVDAHTFLVGCSGYAGGTDGIFRTTDAGMHWTQVSSASASNHPLQASDGALYWPMIYDGGLLKSVDQGQTWMQIVPGGMIRSATPVELPDHRLAAAGFTTVVLSSDGGMNWTPVGTASGDAFPYTPAVLTYSPFRRAFFVSHSDCSNNVPMDAVEEYGFDYTKQ
jgi:photosystem II stability/assembly factor-like uncharacterized protein